MKKQNTYIQESLKNIIDEVDYLGEDIKIEIILKKLHEAYELLDEYIISSNENKPVEYEVYVIWWDDVRYNRMATKEEIDDMRKSGYVIEDGYNGVTFDFRLRLL